jgi:aldehyde:ferredoxin oxidoreductase
MPPDRFYEPIPDGPSKGKKLDKEKIMNQLKIHSILHGWDIEKGVPTKDTLKKLGLEYIRKQMGTRINLC